MMQLNALPDGTHQGRNAVMSPLHSSGAICEAAGGLSRIWRLADPVTVTASLVVAYPKP